MRKLFIPLLIFVLLVGCSNETKDFLVKEPWVDKPKNEWPNIALINKIQYNDTLYDNAGCGFLVILDSITYGVTAKHVISYINLLGYDFNSQFESWLMYVKNNPQINIKMGQILNRKIEDIKDIPLGRDYAIFSVKKESNDIYNLKVRSKPVRKGEILYAIGWTYDDIDCPQKIYPGNCIKNNGDHFLFTLKGRETWGGLSGAPIIDKNGYLVGIVSTGVGNLQKSPSVDFLINIQ